MLPELECLSAGVSRLKTQSRVGRVTRISPSVIQVTGLSDVARIGDEVVIRHKDCPPLEAEVIAINDSEITLLPEDNPKNITLFDKVILLGEREIFPDPSWLGRVIDPRGKPLDNIPITSGTVAVPIDSPPPSPGLRRPLGERKATGLAALNTVLPVVEGQRVGLFAGSGVGKSMMLGRLARSMEADVTIVALIGERGREVQDFVRTTLGKHGMQRTIVVAATSDMPAILRRKCAKTAMALAEYFRDRGNQVLLLADSITRFAEAHRKISSAAGELSALRGFPASTSQQIMQLCERAGPGVGDSGDITAVMTVLVEGSDFDGPIADTMRGVLDGHIVLSRDIAERGRFPAIDLLRSVSRSLPHAASESENALITEVRSLLGSYERSEAMVRSGLYAPGTDAVLDRAVALWPALDTFMGQTSDAGVAESFIKLRACLAPHPSG